MAKQIISAVEQLKEDLVMSSAHVKNATYMCQRVHTLYQSIRANKFMLLKLLKKKNSYVLST